MNTMKINNLHIEVDEKKILKGVNLNIEDGELHVVMGRNGSGKSTLANTICGKDDYTISNGEIFFKENKINNWSPEKRSCEGIFMSFQYPVSIPGVNTMHFLRASVNSIRKSQNKEEYDHHLYEVGSIIWALKNGTRKTNNNNLRFSVNFTNFKRLLAIFFCLLSLVERIL